MKRAATPLELSPTLDTVGCTLFGCCTPAREHLLVTFTFLCSSFQYSRPQKCAKQSYTDIEQSIGRLHRLYRNDLQH